MVRVLLLQLPIPRHTFGLKTGNIPLGAACLKLAARGGKNAKKRAVTAVTRKLAVLLHRLWVTAEAYEPLRNARLQEEALAAVAKA